MHQHSNRRSFLKSGISLAAAGGISLIPFTSTANQAAEKNNVRDENPLCVIGPIAGYAPQIGTLVTMLNYNRVTVINLTKSLSAADLDHLIDPGANTIGALLMHLAAVEKFYQINSFEGRQEFNAEEKKLWNAGLGLGDSGRTEIKGKDVTFYHGLLEQGRQKTLQEFKKKDDKWLLAIDPIWSKEEKYNTYWKWFHVCEHEANHRGQISFLKSRLPGAKKAGTEG